jgi:transposase-like protein
LALMEMYVEGVSTRKVKEITEELCGTSFSKSLVPSLAGRLDAELQAWRDRRLEAGAYPYLFVDARYEKVSEHLQEHVEECLSCLAFPEPHRRRIRTTNGQERLNQEIKRRTRVVRIFPNPQACLRLVTALCVEQSEEWVTGRRYLDMRELEERPNEEQEAKEVMPMER